MADQKESFIEKVLRSVLISSKGGVPLQKLNHEFKELLGQGIPFKENGFPNVEAYLRSMPQVVQIKRDMSGQITCMGVANEETHHLDRLVKKQRATKKKAKPSRVPKFAGRPSNWSRRPPPQNYAYSQSQRKNTNQLRNNANQTSQRPNASSQDVRWNQDRYEEKRMPARNPQPLVRNQQPQVRNPQPQARNQQPPARNPQPQTNRRPPSQKNVHPSHQPRVQHSSSYEVPPRFRRQIQSTGSTDDEHRWDNRDTAPPIDRVERSHSASDYKSSVIENEREWGRHQPENSEAYTETYTPTETHHQPPQQLPQQPQQPPPVDDKVVSWVNQVLADKAAGLWMSGLKKLYREKFQETMDDDLVERLERLSLWTAEEIGVVGNDKILYPSLTVEVTQSPTSGNTQRSVSNQPKRIASFSTTSVPPIVLPEDELWEVYIAFIITVVDFYCIIIGEDYSDKLGALEDDMNEFYLSENMNLQLADKPVINGLYAARDEGDWVRAKIIAVKDDDTAGVFLVDHGDIKSVPFEELRALKQDFFNLAFQAIPCKLNGLDSKVGSKTALTRFCNVALGETRLAEVLSRESPVSLTLYRDQLNINYLCAMGELI